MRESDATVEARRDAEICNACRYCEGYCAVFPALEQRREFTAADLSYLANLCHGCRDCFYACQYAPPHEFGINLPQVFAELRAESHAAHAWPAPLGALFRRNGTVVALAAAVAVVLALELCLGQVSSAALFGAHTGAGAFYAVIPLWLLLTVGCVSFAFGVVGMVVSVLRFRVATGTPRIGAGAALRGLTDALTLRNLGGGGAGCNDRDESFSSARRWLHHAMFYGFLLCFAATCIGTLYHHVFGWVAPYDLASLPVLLGTVGGIGMVVGCGGLIWLKIVGDPAPTAARQLGADYALLALLLLIAATGLGLLALRATEAMGVALAVHVGLVVAFFLMLPYSRMVHALYRLAALARAAAERES
jgi:citrate/tricarballylate utilization protein